MVLFFVVPPGAGNNGVPLQVGASTTRYNAPALYTVSLFNHLSLLLQELVGFQRVHVAAGATTTVWVGITGRDLGLVGSDGVRRAARGRFLLRAGLDPGGFPHLTRHLADCQAVARTSIVVR